MKFKVFDLVKIKVPFLPNGGFSDMATITHISKSGRISVLLESGEFTGYQEEVLDEDIELLATLTDEELDFLKEEI